MGRTGQKETTPHIWEMRLKVYDTIPLRIQYEGKFVISSLRYFVFCCTGSLTSRNARHTASNCTKQLIKCQCFDFLLARPYCSKTGRPQIAPSTALLARASERVHSSTWVHFRGDGIAWAVTHSEASRNYFAVQIARCQAGSLGMTPRRAERRNIDTSSNWRPQTRRYPSNCNF